MAPPRDGTPRSDGVRRAVRTETLGAWVLRSAPGGPHPAEAAARCVRPSYRTALMAAGQPVLVWVSGRDPRRPAGLHAQGWLTGPVDPVTSEVPLALTPLADPVPRSAFLADPVLAAAEVVRMPAGSNPSFLTPEQLEHLARRWPQVRPARAGSGRSAAP